MQDDKIVLMTTVRWLLYKRYHNTIPHCVSCGSVILVGEKTMSFRGRLTKYVCSSCVDKFNNVGVLVHQYPIRRYEKKNMLAIKI